MNNNMINYTKNSDVREKIVKVSTIIARTFKEHKLLLACGNGGSAADAEHLVAEFVGSCYTKHKPWPAVSLCSNAALITALANDFGYENIFSRQVEAFANLTGVLIGFSTSGNSMNVVNAFQMARKFDICTIGITGQNGGKMAPLSCELFCIPYDSTQKIQEITGELIHALVKNVEEIM